LIENVSMSSDKKFRVYADENIPFKVVKFLRNTLNWDVKYVCEDKNLKEKSDLYHHRAARRKKRVLLTRDRGFLDTHWFPFHRTAGVIVLEERNTKRIISSLLLLARFMDKYWNENSTCLSSIKLKVDLKGVTVVDQGVKGEKKEKFYPWEEKF